jgi:hypothetical protein
MEVYRAELERRVSRWAGPLVETTVEISRNALTDKIVTDDDSDVEAGIQEIMAQMVNDWDWLDS